MRRPDERGAVAIFYALVAVMLMGISALAIDLGNGISRKSDVQGQADFAALAAGAQLGTETSGTVPTAVLQAAMDQLNSNRVLNDNGTCRAQAPCVANLADLTNGNIDDGEVRFCSGLNTPAAGCRKAGLQVVAPRAKVDFGFAGIFGVNSINVQATATVGNFSPVGTLPMYAVSGCDYGRQTLTDPANGQGTPLTVPTLAFPADDNGAVLNSLAPSQVPKDAVGANLAITVTGPDHVIRVGFFRPASVGPPAVSATPEVVTIVQDPFLNPTVPVDGNNSFQTVINVTIPNTVTAVEDVWWVRVYTGPGGTNAHQNKWSTNAGALPLRVGASVLECGQGSSGGNFGSLSLERTDVTSVNDQLSMNIINLQAPTSMKANTDPAITFLNSQCFEGVPSSAGHDVAVITDLPNPGQSRGTNCVSTDTGLPAGAATSGLITGIGSTKGRLRDKPTASGCSPTGTSNNASITLQNTTYSVNNDTLSCFLTGNHSVAEIASAGYSGGSALSDDIFQSPRFFYVPVVKSEPISGGSNRYWIVDFRPAFLTDEVVAATSTKAGPDTATAENGIHIEQNQIKSIKVIFFNINALPDRTDGAVQDYIGVGPRILRLVD
jgi:hypothetical protein